MKDYRIAIASSFLFFAFIYLALLLYDITVVPQKSWGLVAIFTCIFLIISLILGAVVGLTDSNSAIEKQSEFWIVLTIQIFFCIVMIYNVIMHTHDAVKLFCG